MVSQEIGKKLCKTLERMPGVSIDGDIEKVVSQLSDFDLQLDAQDPLYH